MRIDKRALLRKVLEVKASQRLRKLIQVPLTIRFVRRDRVDVLMVGRGPTMRVTIWDNVRI